MSKSASLSAAQKEAIRWQSRLSDKKCSDKVKQDFDHWLASSPENADAFQMIQYFWDQLEDLQSAAEPELKEARCFAKKSQASRRYRNITLTLLLLVFGLVAAQPNLALKTVSRHYQTARGDTVSINLSDGGSIKLNTDSDIRVADIFSWRKAWLEKGEAWFTIHHNSQKPFEVFAGKGHIWDIGTQFNVLNESNKTTVTVQEGEVALGTDNIEELTLTASQQSGFDNQGNVLEKTEISPELIGSWRSGVLIFQNQSLTEVLKQLSRYHQAEFTVLDPGIQGLAISGRFSTTDLNETLNTLASGMNLNIKQLQPGQFLIKKQAKTKAIQHPAKLQNFEPQMTDFR
jgi:transmembrane sensor